MNKNAYYFKIYNIICLALVVNIFPKTFVNVLYYKNYISIFALSALPFFLMLALCFQPIISTSDSSRPYQTSVFIAVNIVEYYITNRLLGGFQYFCLTSPYIMYLAYAAFKNKIWLYLKHAILNNWHFVQCKSNLNNSLVYLGAMSVKIFVLCLMAMSKKVVFFNIPIAF